MKILPKFLRKKKKKSNKKISGIKKKKTNRSKRKNNRANKRNKSKFLKYLQTAFLIILTICLMGAVIYFSVKLVLKIRNQDEDATKLKNTTMVQGFPNIPEYPYATPIFTNESKKENVQKFLNKGYAIYRIDPNYEIEDVYEYYERNLPQSGWKKIETVPVESTEKMPGQYWIKNEKGIRIYSRINDIWYQKLSANDTRDCLASQVQQKKERELILSQFNTTTFLPDFPWGIELPGEYIVNYKAAEQIEKPTHNEFLEDIQKATITRIGDGENYVLIKPILIYEGGELDKYLDLYATENHWNIDKVEEYNNKNGRCLKVQFSKKKLENETNNEQEQEDEDKKIEQKEILDPPTVSLITLQDSIKIVYSIEKHGEDDEIDKLYDLVIKNIEAVKAEL